MTVSGSRVQGVSLSFHQSVKEKCYIDPVGVTHLHAKKRKSRMKRVIKLPTVSSKMADIPANEYSLRKYDDNILGDDLLGPGAVKINPTDGFIIGSPEKTAKGDAAGMLDRSAVEPALPPVGPVSGRSQQLRKDH
uniref:Zn-cluster domain-containing protein n=1 Tax=Brassica campestris TaxID=3711 RepID=M4DFU9_BRACM